MNARYLLPALAIIPLAGCDGAMDTETGPEQEVTAEELVAALPTADMLEARYPGYTAQEKPSGDAAMGKMAVSSESDGASCADAGNEETAFFYQDGCEVITYVNGVVRDVMDLLHTAVTHEPTHQGGGVYIWGPFQPSEGVTLMFGMQKNEDGSIGYKLDGKRTEDPDSAYLTLLRGRIEEGEDLGNNVGSFDISYDNIQQVDPSREVGGTAAYDYDSLGTQTGVHARLHDILGGDGARHQAEVTYYVNEDSSGEMWYGFTDDIKVTEDTSTGVSGVQEVAKVHTRWLSDGQGRSDATITGGDLGEQTGFVTECWDADYFEVYAAANWAGETGDASLCVFESPQFPQ